ncbi:hypothetical protein V502_05287 [Pseudogymnoascus sp. VKM F-4520 (FW-2644)]|nr:hypothetical protein V502_05287 [Pseudogymnoascus sp. VKM F-4520 (FW-2644)]
MGFWDFVEAATPWSTVEAEAPAKEEEETETATTEKTEEATEEAPAEEEEEEEEEEDIVDPKETLEAECRESKECAAPKHHFDECVERVTAAEDKGGSKEDCVEEFFHLAHCATACSAPKLWAQLK